MTRFESPIEPSVGRIVLVRGSALGTGDVKREYPGIVTKSWGRNCINAQVFNEERGGIVITSIQYDGDVDADGVAYAAWKWMPYQVQTAASAAAKEAAQ